MRKVIFRIATAVIAIIVIVAPSVASPATNAAPASGWQAGRIVDDTLFTNPNDMSVTDIQNFLNSKVTNCDTWGTQPASEYNRPDLTHAQYAASRGWPSPPYVCLRDYYEVPKTNAGDWTPDNNYSHNALPFVGSVSAAQIIYNAAQQYNINPKALLVKIGTESSGPLTSDSWPLRTQYTYAMGAHCPDSGPGGSAVCDPNYAGFSIQVSEAGALLRWYLDSMTQPWWQYKKPFTTNSILWNVAPSGCGAGDVHINTKATAALYTYTPYQPNQAALNNMYGTGDGCSAYGNRNFWRTWFDWFGSPQTNIAYAWQYAGQSAYQDSNRSRPFTSTPTVKPGGTVYLQVKAKNIGYQTWSNAITRLGTSKPTDLPSVFSTPNWLAQTRPASLFETSVHSGDIGTFNFEMKMPNTAGTYRQYYNILIEGQQWLNDPGYHVTVNVNDDHPDAISSRPTLLSGQVLDDQSYLLSQDGQSTLSIEKAGHLVLRSNFAITWLTSKNNTTGNKLIMQPDGNLVLYDSLMKPLWNTETFGNPGSWLALQPDGNLVLYSATNVPLWATYTVQIPNHTSTVINYVDGGAIILPFQNMNTPSLSRNLLLQSDGNLVLYDSKNKALWSAGTHGRKASFAAFQTDGNLVVYNADHIPLWNSRTAGNPGSRLVLQDDGNLVIYNRDEHPLWATYTDK